MIDKRLDLYIKDSIGISRKKAQDIIKNNCVCVNGKIINKPSYIVSENDNIEVSDTEDVLKYVGRGGYKLEGAINTFNIGIKGVCVDIGASTGGFTDCMLKKGAELVYAVDVGSNQLDESLKKDKRVVSMENTDIRKAELPSADFIGCDVSFISITKVLPCAFNILKEKGRGVFLIKPQFEAGKENLSKRGIVKNIKVHKKAVRDIINFANNIGFFVKDLTYSPIKGGDGNIEYLMYLIKDKGERISDTYCDNVVEKAFNAFSR